MTTVEFAIFNKFSLFWSYLLMDLVGRRRQSTLEFFKSIELFGLSLDHQIKGPENRSGSVVKQKRKKGWAIIKNILPGTLGNVLLREPILITASQNGSPLSLTSCISYAPFEVEKRLFFFDEAAPGTTTFHPGIDDIGKSRKSESYKHLLMQKSSSESSHSDAGSELSSYSSISSSDSELSRRMPEKYDPLFLDDPDLTTGRHRTIVSLSGFMSSIIHYAGEEEIKKELNERFRQMHPYIHPSISLSKIRNLKNSLLKAALSCDVELVTVACSFALLEKLMLAGHVIKANRRVCGACCLLLSAKLCDYREQDFHDLIQALSETLEIPVADIMRAEFSVLVTLSFSIYIPHSEYLPHFERIFSELEYCNFQEYLGEKMYNLWTKDSE
jgi:hypothetical protein